MQDRSARIQPHLLVNKYVDGVPYANKVLNLSESGVALSSSVEPEHREGAHVVLELVIDTVKTPLWLECTPIRRSLPRIDAFEFTNVDVANQRIMKRFVDAHRIVE